MLYFFHGLGDNEQSLLSGGWDIISDLRSKGKIGDFIILAPRGGHTFYLNSENGKIRYEDFLMKEFMPQMEKKYRVEGTRATRGITGVSMGGYGALRLAFKYPDEFAAVSAQMPALIIDVPKDMAASSPGSPGALMGDVFGNPINRTYFDRNNVFYFARTDSVASLKRMKIYFDVGNNDDYGFEQGAAGARQAAHLTRHSARVPPLSWSPRFGIRRPPLRRRDPVPMERHRGREVKQMPSRPFLGRLCFEGARPQACR